MRRRDLPGPLACAASLTISIVGMRGILADFGQQRKLPGWFRPLLFHWLDLFHVVPRADLERELLFLARRNGLHLDYRELYRGYADYAVLTA